MDLPEHLDTTMIEKCPPPTTRADRRPSFSSFDPRDFEQLCCDLVENATRIDNPNAEIQSIPIDGDGKSQRGGDFLLIFDPGSTEIQLALYEVKRVKEFSKRDFEQTIGRFLENYDFWSVAPSEFHLMLAKDLDADITKQYLIHMDALSKKKVKFRIWGRNDIEKLLEKAPPDLIHKHFNDWWLEAYYGKRGRFHIEQYGPLSFKEPQPWRNYSGERETTTENSFRHLNDHIHLTSHVFPPDASFTTATIDFLNRKYRNISIYLSHSDLLNTLFVGTGAPTSNNTRSFLTPLGAENFHCYLGGISLELSHAEATALCQAADSFQTVYKTKARYLESSWRSHGFRAWSGFGSRVPLLQVSTLLWFRILSFARSHDAFETSGDWSIFDSHSEWLKIYSKTPSPRLEAGYHVFIEALPERVIRTPEDGNYLTLFWRPPSSDLLNQLQTTIGPRGYWDALTTHEWLREKLIPAVLELDNKERMNLLNWNRLRSQHCGGRHKNWDQEPYLVPTSLYSPQISTDDIRTLPELLNLLRRLQSFYSTQPINVYFDNKISRHFYRAIHMVISNTQVESHEFFRSNLSLPKGYSEDEIKTSLLELAHNLQVSLRSSFVIDCALRCALVCVRDGSCHLNDYEIQNMAQLLRAIDDFREDQELLARQRNRIA